ncbi:hypothetical protein N7532_005500 [Penicillium argentinense]|uniref:Uncharacterized protein n=1 Tax=Penicillium argentinense TaxID=1131581 RepID=A0A9W9FE55_9EURO|nr:uncharacterized protein N7532_005500 [Penicillium argentinense]KAJ5098499.1 hypothetical protein N7532_005500 [Penicillium argentinense]
MAGVSSPLRDMARTAWRQAEGEGVGENKEGRVWNFQVNKVEVRTLRRLEELGRDRENRSRWGPRVKDLQIEIQPNHGGTDGRIGSAARTSGWFCLFQGHGLGGCTPPAAIPI